jgi:integrase
VDPTRTTLIEYLRDWHEKKVQPLRRPETARVYLSVIDTHVAKARIASVPLQKVRAADLEAFYATLKLAPSTVTVVHAVISRALKVAVRDKLLVANPAAAVEDRPKVEKDVGRVARDHSWTAEETRRVLAAAKEDGAQASAFFAVLLDTGCRKSEALGLTWDHVDLDNATLTIARQLEPRSTTTKLVLGPTKTGRSRTITLNADTVERLRLHRKQQRELMMANRTSYQDNGLVFAKEQTDLQTTTAALGQPCFALVERHFRRVVSASGVRRIKVHGTRHTVATLMLQAGVPVQVVAQRLGHAQISQTLEVYAHAQPDMQRDAAARLGALLSGG